LEKTQNLEPAEKNTYTVHGNEEYSDYVVIGLCINIFMFLGKSMDLYQ
jgi:hypothetical protein